MTPIQSTNPPNFASYACNDHGIDAKQFYAHACDPRQHIVIEACAGSGKTWILVSRILRILIEDFVNLSKVCPQSILAITFTKKAAQEMQLRLYELLEQLSEMTLEVQINELMLRGLNLEQASQYAPYLKPLYLQLLLQPKSVQFRTFHGWFANLIQQLPLAERIGHSIPLNYQLIENNSTFLPAILRRLYASARQQGIHCNQQGHNSPYVVLQQLLQTQGKKRFESSFEAILQKYAELTLLYENHKENALFQPNFEHFSKVFPRFSHCETHVFPENLLLTKDSFSQWKSWIDALPTEKKTPQTLIKAKEAANAALVTAQEALAQGKNPEQVARSLFTTLKSIFFTKKELRLDHRLKKTGLLDEVESELQLIEDVQNYHQMWLFNARMHTVVPLFLQHYRSMKIERGWLDMADLELITYKIIHNSELGAYLQEQLDFKFEHLLLDEFQDANTIQWKILNTWLSSYVGAGSGKEPKLFVVGDPKQSIYYFRGANPEIFAAAKKFVCSNLNGLFLSCNHTRRNAQAIIARVNQALPLALKHLYTDTASPSSRATLTFQEHTTAVQEMGEITLLPSATDQPSTANNQTKPVQSTLQTECETIANHIQHCVNNGQLSARHFLILARQHSHLDTMQHALLKAGIACNIEKKQFLIDTPEIQDVVAFLDCLLWPWHTLTFARALKSPILGLSDHALVALVNYKNTYKIPRQNNENRSYASSWQTILLEVINMPATQLPQLGITKDMQTHFRDIYEQMALCKQRIMQLPLYEALCEVYKKTNILKCYERVYGTSIYPQIKTNLNAFLNATLNFKSARYPSIYTFIRACQRKITSAYASEYDLLLKTAAANEQSDLNTVRLLTIHQAKGLESDAVILLNTDAPKKNNSNDSPIVTWSLSEEKPSACLFIDPSTTSVPHVLSVLTQKQFQYDAQSNINALYVALTRAKQYLIISSHTPSKNSDPQSWWKIISAQLDTSSYRCPVEP